MLPLFYRSDDHEEIRRIFPSAKFETISGAGHWVHADKPHELLDILKDFIQTVQTIEGNS
jgi:abhydrolase domain-containing protein 11